MKATSQAEKNVFGEDCELHPITKMPLENGIGAKSADQQAEMHVLTIEQHHGKEAADTMRRKLADAKTIKIAEADMAKD